MLGSGRSILWRRLVGFRPVGLSTGKVRVLRFEGLESLESLYSYLGNEGVWVWCRVGKSWLAELLHITD